MARPSDKLNLIMVDIGRSLEAVAVITRGASAVDTLALDYCVQAFSMACQWRRDHTDTARRHAFGAASAAKALATAPSLAPDPTGRGAHVRRALATFATAMQRVVEGDAVGALECAAQARAINPARAIRAA